MRLHARDFDVLFLGAGGLGCILFVIALAAFIAFLAAIDRAVKRVEPENRRIEPGMVWLNLIPLFNVLWMIVTIERVGESIRNEFIARGRHKFRESYGKTAGLAFMFLFAIGVSFAIAEMPCVPLIFCFFALIYWVVYWYQISGYARRLNTDNPSYSPPPDEGW